MRHRGKSRNKGEAAKLEMTPMIDVVFQLLIFFVVTLKQEDILSHLAISRPTRDEKTPPVDTVELLTVLVGPRGYTLNGRPYRGAAGFAALDKHLSRMASFSRTTTVIVKCTGDAPHSHLVRLLNICARERMENLAVFSM
jgi:biopolymer transport protein ExbD